MTMVSVQRLLHFYQHRLRISLGPATGADIYMSPQ